MKASGQPTPSGGKRKGLFARRKKKPASAGGVQAVTVDDMRDKASEEAAMLASAQRARTTKTSSTAFGDGEGWIERPEEREEAGVAVSSTLAVGVVRDISDGPSVDEDAAMEEKLEQMDAQRALKLARKAAEANQGATVAAPAATTAADALVGGVGSANRPLSVAERARLRAQHGHVPSGAARAKAAASGAGFVSIDAAFGAGASSGAAGAGAPASGGGGGKAAKAGGGSPGSAPHNPWAVLQQEDDEEEEAEYEALERERAARAKKPKGPLLEAPKLRLGEGFAPKEGPGAPLPAAAFDAVVKDALEAMTFSLDVDRTLTIAEQTNAEEGPAARARFVTMAIRKAIEENWEPKERAAVRPLAVGLLERHLLTRADLNRALRQFFVPASDDDIAPFEVMLEDLPIAGEIVAKMLVDAWDRDAIDPESLHRTVSKKIEEASREIAEQREQEAKAIAAAEAEREKRSKPDPSKMSWKEKLEARKAGLI